MAGIDRLARGAAAHGESDAVRSWRRLTNKKRTDLTLGLVTLNLNESHDQRRYAASIREHLDATGGSPAIVRGTICDPKGKPTSLRG